MERHHKTTNDNAILNEKRISSKNDGIGKMTMPKAAITSIGVPRPERKLNFYWKVKVQPCAQFVPLKAPM